MARYGEAIWTASRDDEGTISATGANIVARAAMAVADAEVTAMARKAARRIVDERRELARYKRGGKTLGEIIEWQCRAVLDASGMHHLINEDGDGDWGLVWERLAELRPRLEAAEVKLARVEALAMECERRAKGAD
jgi:hypothetical protein